MGYSDLMESVDMLVVGQKTYEKVLSLGAWPYGQKPVVVQSSRPIVFPFHLPETVTNSAENPRTLCNRLFREGAKHLYVDGGNTIQRFLSEGLIDDLTITFIPVIMGKGIPLFGPILNDVWLTCTGIKSYESGFVQLHRVVARSGERTRTESGKT